jgi:hypothetical protein
MADEKAKKAPKTEKTSAPAAEGAPGAHCRADKCKQPVRAKGYCRKHYIGWRRGDVGGKHRYNTCSKEECRKPATVAGRCEEHKKGAGAPAAAPAA